MANIKREVKYENTSFVTDLNKETDKKLQESLGLVLPGYSDLERQDRRVHQKPFSFFKKMSRGYQQGQALVAIDRLNT